MALPTGALAGDCLVQCPPKGHNMSVEIIIKGNAISVFMTAIVNFTEALTEVAEARGNRHSPHHIPISCTDLPRMPHMRSPFEVPW